MIREIRITETRERIVRVDGSTDEIDQETLDAVVDLYRNGKLALSSNDYKSVEFEDMTNRF